MSTTAIRSQTINTRNLRRTRENDPLSAARGIMIGSTICLGFWGLVAAAIIF